MRNVFIVNPNAGKRGGAGKLINAIHSYFRETNEKYTVYTTENDRRGGHYAALEAQKGDAVRIFACGGDGTMFDVFNGMADYKNAVLGVIPCGTANDFIKYFSNRAFEVFSDIKAQMNGTVHRLDAIRACGHYALNSCSIGMDADVCENKDRFSRIPLIYGKTAYIMSLFYCFFSSIRNRLSVSIDDADEITGDFLFAVAGNARYYGGGFKCTPDAVVDDGLLDCMTINSVSRLKIASLLSCYTKGEHVNREFCTIKRGKKMTVKAQKETAVNMDGEIFRAKEVTFEIVPDFARFIVPDGISGDLIQNEKLSAENVG